MCGIQHNKLPGIHSAPTIKAFIWEAVDNLTDWSKTDNYIPN